MNTLVIQKKRRRSATESGRRADGSSHDARTLLEKHRLRVPSGQRLRETHHRRERPEAEPSTARNTLRFEHGAQAKAKDRDAQQVRKRVLGSCARLSGCATIRAELCGSAGFRTAVAAILLGLRKLSPAFRAEFTAGLASVALGARRHSATGCELRLRLCLSPRGT